MSVLGIAGSSLFQYLSGLSQSNNSSQSNFRQEFQQLGQDLQAVNLSAAQSAFQALQPQGTTPQTPATSQTSNNPIANAFTQLGQDLSSGNLSAAQQDYSTIQQDAQQISQSAHHFHHHHAASSQNSSSQNSISQLFAQLGQDLQSGSLSTAQAAYTSLQQAFQQLGAPAVATSPVSSTPSNNVSVSA
jgi:outer membrane protein assembly factor BamD (BamD/ComL family)